MKRILIRSLKVVRCFEKMRNIAVGGGTVDKDHVCKLHYKRWKLGYGCHNDALVHCG